MLNNLTKQELINIIQSYDKYVQNCNEDNIGADRLPVCIDEFYINEYQEDING